MILGIAGGGVMADRTSPARVLSTGVLLMVPVGAVFGTAHWKLGAIDIVVQASRRVLIKR